MNPVFSNIVDLVGGLIIAEKKKKKKLRVVSAKYPSSAIMAIKARIKARPVLPAYVAPLGPLVPAKRGRKPGSKNKKTLLAEEDARRVKAEEDETLRNERGAVREERLLRGSEAVRKRSERKAKKEVETRPKAPGTRRKAKPEEAKEEELFVEARPATVFPEEDFIAVRPSLLKFTPGKESGLKKDGTPALSTTKGRELAARVELGEIPPFVPIPKVSPFASVRREASVAPPATVPKKKADPAKKKALEQQARDFAEGLAPVRAAEIRAQAKAKKASPREETRPAIVEAPGFPPAIGSGMRRRRRVRRA